MDMDVVEFNRRQVSKDGEKTTIFKKVLKGTARSGVVTARLTLSSESQSDLELVCDAMVGDKSILSFRDANRKIDEFVDVEEEIIEDDVKDEDEIIEDLNNRFMQGSITEDELKEEIQNYKRRRELAEKQEAEA